MSVSIKSVSTSQIQDAFSKALSELTGKPCSVSVSNIDYGAYDSIFKSQSIKLSASATINDEEDPNEKPPF
jgi:chemotaxis protein CheY-P-specific phosphatase CheC